MPRRRGTKVKDKWRDKAWINVETPPYFGSTIIAKIPTGDFEKAVGRVIHTTLFDLMKQDPQQYTIMLSFQITKVEEDKASTILKGQEFTREYLRSLIRRGSSMVDAINDYTTSDGYKFRAYVVCFTQHKVNSSKKNSIRKAIYKVLQEKTNSTNYDKFIQEVVYGKIASDITDEVKKLLQMRYIGVRKVKLLSIPLQIPEGVEQASS